MWRFAIGGPAGRVLAGVCWGWACWCGGLVDTTCWADETPVKVNYDEQVRPILRDNCFACHGQDDAKSDLALDNFASAMRGGASGAVLVPGDPDASRLWQLVSHQESPQMPPEQDKLPAEQLETLRLWIEQGALENAGSTAIIKKKPKLEFRGGGAARPEGPLPMPEGLSRRALVRAERATVVTALAANPWSPLVAVASQSQVLLYHAETAELLGVLPFAEGTPHVVKFSRDGSLLLVGGGRGGQSGRVVVFDVRTGNRTFEIGEELDAVLAADINEDHTQIALGGPGKVVRCYSTADGSLLYEIRKHTDWIYALGFSPDGVLLATADRNGGLFVWEAETAREYLNLRGHEGAVTDLTWRDDSNVLASSSEDGTVRQWEMEQGQQVKSWAAHAGGALAVGFAHDGQLVSAGRDRLAKLWNTDGSLVKEFEAFGDLAMDVVILHDGLRLAAGDWTGEIRLWNVADGVRVANLPINPLPLESLADTARQQLMEVEALATAVAAEIPPLHDQLAQATAAVDAAGGQVATTEGAAAQVAHLRETVAQIAAERVKTLEVAQAALAAATEAVRRSTEEKAAADQLLAAQQAALDAATAAHVAARTALEQAASTRTAAETALAAKTAAEQAARQRADALRKSLEQLAADLAAQASQAPVQPAAAEPAVSTNAAPVAAEQVAEQPATSTP